MSYNDLFKKLFCLHYRLIVIVYVIVPQSVHVLWKSSVLHDSNKIQQIKQDKLGI